MKRATFLVRGVVQGVGFRPFVYRLARTHGVTGSVCNTSAQVIVDAQGPAAALDAIGRELRTKAPALARVLVVERIDTEPDPALRGFVITESHDEAGARTIVPPDTAVCADCVRELFNPADRRHRHPFITCTNCGPRFTIIRDLPYDRPGTTLADMPMCPACEREYRDPGDRRFHAQPVSCQQCGPRLSFTASGTTPTASDEECLAAAVPLLAAGRILAIKGIGGFHVACSAVDDAAVQLLRTRKAREAKPFAVMVPDLATARTIAEVSDAEAEQLMSPAAPIVLVRRRPDAEVPKPLRVASAVAPGNTELGVMVAYTPVHHLLFADGAPKVLVMTSGNISGEPICYTDHDAASRLVPIADAILGHNRPIAVPCDDSVLRVIGSQVHPLRRSRGYAPMPVLTAPPEPAPPKSGPATAPSPHDTLDTAAITDLAVPAGPAVFAVGGELKAAVCLLDGERAYLSQHLGDMESLASQAALAQATSHLAALYQVKPEVWACDLHPDYHSRRWAERNHDVPLIPVQHHHAHAVSLLAEHQRLGQDVLVMAFDGTGYGTDGVIWGGEALLLGEDVSAFERIGHLAEVRLPGGDAAVAQPWRIALAHLAAAGLPWDADLPCVRAAGADAALLHQLLDRQAATTPSTSIGRLFDAVASLLGVCQEQGYEAQAAIELEQLAVLAHTPSGFPAHRVHDLPAPAPPAALGGLDPAPILTHLVAGLRTKTPVARLAWDFHSWVADAVRAWARCACDERGVTTVGLSGGVFANGVLTDLTTTRLTADGFTVLTHSLVPAGDGGLALGQALIARAVMTSRAGTAPEMTAAIPAGQRRPIPDHTKKENT